MSPPAPRAPAVFVHIGEPKTGTTYLQNVLWTNRDELAEHGVLVPGARPLAHWRAAQDLREIPQVANDPLGPNAGSWERLAKEALTARRVAVISHELLSAATVEQAARGVRSLDGADVHVVVTVRDFGSLLPAEWQETVKHRSTRTWHDWVSGVLEREAGDPDRRRFFFWRVHDTLQVLRAWGAQLPADHVHVLTVPPRGADRDLLWQRFAGMLGIDPALADTSRVRSNASLGWAEVELLRRINQQMPAELPDWFYMRYVKDALAHLALAGRSRSAGHLDLPPHLEKLARQHADELVAGLQASDYDIVGDLAELVPRPMQGPVVVPEDLAADQLLDPALTAVTALLVELGQMRGIGLGDEARELRPAGPVKRAVITLSQRSTTVFRARRAYWRLAAAARQLRAAQQPAPGENAPLQ